MTRLSLPGLLAASTLVAGCAGGVAASAPTVPAPEANASTTEHVGAVSVEPATSEVVGRCAPVAARTDAVASDLRAGAPAHLDGLQAAVDQCVAATDRARRTFVEDEVQAVDEHVIAVRQLMRELASSLATLERDAGPRDRAPTDGIEPSGVPTGGDVTWRVLAELAEEVRVEVERLA